MYIFKIHKITFQNFTKKICEDSSTYLQATSLLFVKEHFYHVRHNIFDSLSHP